MSKNVDIRTVSVRKQSGNALLIHKNLQNFLLSRMLQ